MLAEVVPGGEHAVRVFDEDEGDDCPHGGGGGEYGGRHGWTGQEQQRSAFIRPWKSLTCCRGYRCMRRQKIVLLCDSGPSMTSPRTVAVAATPIQDEEAPPRNHRSPGCQHRQVCPNYMEYQNACVACSDSRIARTTFWFLSGHNLHLYGGGGTIPTRSLPCLVAQCRLWEPSMVLPPPLHVPLAVGNASNVLIEEIGYPFWERLILRPLNHFVYQL